MGFAIHWHESAMGVHVSPSLPIPPHPFPSLPIPQGRPRAPTLSALSHASNLEWSSVSHMVICTFQGCSLKSIDVLLFTFYLFWLPWVFPALPGLPLAAVSGGAGGGRRPSRRCTGFPVRGLLLLRSTGSGCTGFSSCGFYAPSSVAVAQGLSCSPGMWDLPRPGIKPPSLHWQAITIHSGTR